MKTIVIVFLFVLIATASGDYGVDVSQLTSSASFSCLKTTSPGYTFAIVRAWKSSGTPDTNCPQTVANAWAAGLNNVDVYMYPCFTCGDPQGQVRNCISNLTASGTNFTTFWLDVENGTTSGYWSNNQSANVEFFQGLLDASTQLGLKIGVYASKYQWGLLMGSWAGASQYPLWYPRYDSNPAFSDWTTFGGWSAPVMKQYQGTTSICGASVDYNWFPPSPSPTATPTPTVTPSRTPSRSPSSTPSTSASPSVTPTPTKSVTPSRTPSRSPSASRSPSRSPSRTPSVTPTSSATPTVTPTTTPTVSVTATPSVSPSDPPVPSASASPTDPPASVVSPLASPPPVLLSVCPQCNSNADCSNGRGVCVTSSIGNYCSCLSGFGGCDCSVEPNPSCSASFGEVSTLGGKFKANTTVDYEYPNLYVAVEANLEENAFSSASNTPPYSLETLIYFGSSPNAFPACSYPNGEHSWKDFAAGASCTDLYLSNMTWSFARNHCGFEAISGSRNYTQKVTVVRRYSLNGVIQRTEKSSRYISVNFPSEIELSTSSIDFSFPEANAFAALSAIDYDPDTQLWTVVVQTSLNDPYSIGSSVAAQYTGNLGLRAPTVSVSECTPVDSACVQTITYTYPQGSVSDPCLALSGNDLHTFAVQCTTPSCPGSNLFNITLRLNTGNACPSTDDINFSEASLGTFSDSALENAQDTFSVTETVYVGAQIQSTEALITSRSLKPNSVCFKPVSGPCFYAAYTELPSTNGKDPVFKVDLTDSSNTAYFGSLVGPTEFTVKASILVQFSGEGGAKSTRSLPKTQTVEMTATAVIGGEKSTVTSDAVTASPFMLMMLVIAFFLY